MLSLKTIETNLPSSKTQNNDSIALSSFFMKTISQKTQKYPQIVSPYVQFQVLTSSTITPSLACSMTTAKFTILKT